MNGVSRFLSRREKKTKASAGSEKGNHINRDLYKLFQPEDSRKSKDKEEDKKVSSALDFTLSFIISNVGKVVQQRNLTALTQVKAILARLEAAGFTDIKDLHVEYALRSRSTDGNVEKAYELLVLLEDALHGTLRPYHKDTKLLGAENRELVTCYLDSLLFAMFARLDSFENMLAIEYQDAARKKLVMVLRLWVNMLRTGKLITTDITKHLQEALGACGWEDATKLRQQDVSEAFTFITGKLDLPLLSLKMDVYHTGKEDADDHKIVKERLLDVAIPDPPEDGTEIKLEDCLEAYFNNRIEVKRHLQRRNTMQSMRGERSQGSHLDTTEASSSSALNPPHPAAPPTVRSLSAQERPSHDRSDSIFKKQVIEHGEPSEQRSKDDINIHKRIRAATIKREVLMPAWQFFSLIPAWSTHVRPSNDVQVVQHLSSKRPILGICLKRYSMTTSGVGSRRDTYIDIPLEIGLPHFISDERTDTFGPNFTNFKLSLQSVICHRGNSLDSGHYVALVRGDAANAVLPDADWQLPQPANGHQTQSQKPSASSSLEHMPESQHPEPRRSGERPATAVRDVPLSGSGNEPHTTKAGATASETAEVQTTHGGHRPVQTYRPADQAGDDRPPAHDDYTNNRMPPTQWLLFDDLAKERVRYVDMRKALRDECPYLLFYQVQPIDESYLMGLEDPPSYESIMNGDADRAENGTINTVGMDGIASEINSIAPSIVDPNVSEPSIVSLSTVSVDPARNSMASEISHATDDTEATSTTLTSVPGPSEGFVPLHKSKSVNIAILQRESQNDSERALSGIDAVDHAALLSDGLTMRPRSIDLSALGAAAPATLVAAGSLDLPQGRNSMSSADRHSIAFTDADQRSSMYTGSAKGGSSAPITPGDEPEGKGGFLGMTRSRRGSVTAASGGRSSWRRNRSRPTSQSGEGRLSLNLSAMGMSRLKAAVSKDKLSHIESQDRDRGDDSGNSQIDDSNQHARTGSPDNRKTGGLRSRKSLRRKAKSRSASAGRLDAHGKDAFTPGERPDRECSVM